MRISAEYFLERLGYRRCDIPACNCGSWHQHTDSAPRVEGWQPPMSPAEAIYLFAAMLTSLSEDRRIVCSAFDDASPVATLCAEFCRKHDLGEPWSIPDSIALPRETGGR